MKQTFASGKSALDGVAANFVLGCLHQDWLRCTRSHVGEHGLGRALARTQHFSAHDPLDRVGVEGAMLFGRRQLPAGAVKLCCSRGARLKPERHGQIGTERSGKRGLTGGPRTVALDYEPIRA